MTKKPRSRSSRTFATVAGFDHIAGCIAGTMSFGAVLAKIVFVKRSSARPCAILAIRSAVAGATIRKSLDPPNETWRTSSTFSQTVVVTGRPDRASHVALPTKFRLEGVGITVTPKP